MMTMTMKKIVAMNLISNNIRKRTEVRFFFMIFKTNFIPYTTDRDLRRNVSLISVVLYFFLIFTNFIEWDNFFFLSILVGVQLYFWFGQQKEVYHFSPHQLHIQFLWLKKSISFDYYNVIIQSSKNSKDYIKPAEYQQIQLFIKIVKYFHSINTTILTFLKN